MVVMRWMIRRQGRIGNARDDYLRGELAGLMKRLGDEELGDEEVKAGCGVRGVGLCVWHCFRCIFVCYTRSNMAL
jgi:hypothetical protein